MSPEDFAEYLDDLGEHCESGSFEEPLREVLPVLMEGFEQNFMRAENESGTPWPPRVDDLPHPLLILSGALIEATRDTGSAGNIHTVSERNLETGVKGSVIAYASIHNDGAGNIPQRQFLYASPETSKACAEAFASSAYFVLFGFG